MNTLTSAPVSSLLQQLFQEAAQVNSPELASISPEQREQFMRSKTGYRELYARIKEMWLPVSAETGQLLYMLARASHARYIVEFGTSFGISTIYLAAALRDNGGGLIITTEFETTKLVRAKQHLQQAGLSDLVEFRSGDALQTLSQDLPAAIDMVLLDGAKALYDDVLNLLEAHLRPGALILADNTNYCPDYLQRVRDPAQHYLSLAFNQEVELSMWSGRKSDHAGTGTKELVTSYNL